MTVYHYTSINTLFHILNGIEHKTEENASEDSIEYYSIKLHASNAMFLNDPTEHKLFIDSFSEAFENDPKLNSFIKNLNLLTGAPYALSFSEAGDDLNMWRSYADNAYGVALGFKAEDLNQITKSTSSDKIQFSKCKYRTKQDIIEEIKQSIDYKVIKNDLKNVQEEEKIRIDNITCSLFENSLFYKDIAYKSEKEWRLGIFAHFDSLFKNRNSEIINYKEVIIPLSALKQIIFAPLVNFDKLHYSVSKMLHEKIGSSINIDIKISKSRIPYSG